MVLSWISGGRAAARRVAPQARLVRDQPAGARARPLSRPLADRVAVKALRRGSKAAAGLPFDHDKDDADMRKQERSPQEKKALSYAKDCRNTYGESDKGARKIIPFRKALERRQDRRKVARELGLLPRLEEEAADLVESSARHDTHRVGGWTKAADDPLGTFVARRLEMRESRAGGKARRRVAQERLREILGRLNGKSAASCVPGIGGEWSDP